MRERFKSSRRMAQLTCNGVAPHNSIERIQSPALTEWIGDTSRFEQFLVGSASRVPQVPSHKVLPTMAPSSQGSSMIATIDSGPQRSSMASNDVPSLTMTGATISVETSRESRFESSVQIAHSHARESNGAAYPAAEDSLALYQCAFNFLGCNRSFYSRDDWESHSLTHFHGHRPPSSAQCPLCIWSAPIGADAWKARMDHVAEHHRRGECLGSFMHYPDRALFRHLKSIAVVTMNQYQELELNRSCNPTVDYCERNDPGKDRRKGVPQTSTRRRPR